MTKSSLPESVHNVERTTSENVNTLMFRSKLTGRSLSKAVGFAQATASRKLNAGGWSLGEVVVLARFFRVTLDELTTTLPGVVEWQSRQIENGAEGSPSAPSLLPRLDSNQQPSGYPLSQVRAGVLVDLSAFRALRMAS